MEPLAGSRNTALIGRSTVNTILLLVIPVLSLALVESPVSSQTARIMIEVNPKEPRITIPSDFIGFSYETRNLKRDEIVFGENDAALDLR